ncbi:hypothetical protein MAA_10595 [Metarhizium robertsii ARSEF 23]|uniref:Uncharacterized protein n=1 Tax=Metarhizium robertsii (strain ARSEF 23 / ATCC MYA-3075) TaxID=655844 RepID=A0A0B2XIJ3_METRA|nr:uncharacterized protein MAA_10595 [Metarhizium robertsii ARSEF 23]KHO11651.1 hypothetical protein MAA_10595 [Metarhizium robertsii ARSEF 23]
MTCGDLLLSALRDSPRPPLESISPTDVAAPFGMRGSKAGGKGNAVGVYQASRLVSKEKPTATKTPRPVAVASPGKAIAGGGGGCGGSMQGQQWHLPSPDAP